MVGGFGLLRNVNLFLSRSFSPTKPLPFFCYFGLIFNFVCLYVCLPFTIPSNGFFFQNFRNFEIFVTLFNIPIPCLLCILLVFHATKSPISRHLNCFFTKLVSSPKGGKLYPLPWGRSKEGAD